MPDPQVAPENAGVHYGDWNSGLVKTPFYDYKLFFLGDRELPNTPSFTYIRMPPNGVAPRHAHSSSVACVVLEGRAWLPGGAVLGPGEFFVVDPEIQYGPFSAGPDGAVFLEIIGTVDGLFPVFDDPADPLTREMIDYLGNQFDDAGKPTQVGQVTDG